MLIFLLNYLFIIILLWIKYLFSIMITGAHCLQTWTLCWLWVGELSPPPTQPSWQTGGSRFMFRGNLSRGTFRLLIVLQHFDYLDLRRKISTKNVFFVLFFNLISPNSNVRCWLIKFLSLLNCQPSSGKKNKFLKKKIKMSMNFWIKIEFILYSRVWQLNLSTK